MNSEKRKHTRVRGHFVVKFMDAKENRQYYGYIENLSEGGIGVATLDNIISCEQVSTMFFLPGIAAKITPLASLVHIRKGLEMLNYYGFKFNYVTPDDRALISSFIETELRKTAV